MYYNYIIIILFCIVLILKIMRIYYTINKKSKTKIKTEEITNYDNVNEIQKNLWVGNYKSSFDTNFIKNNNIKLIINLSKDIPFSNIHGIQYFRVPIHDNLSIESDNGMIHYFPKCYHLINSYLNNNEGVLIHCWAGMQRSATLCALYIMKHYNKSFNVVKHIVKKNRQHCFTPGVNFHRSIYYLENNNFNYA